MRRQGVKVGMEDRCSVMLQVLLTVGGALFHLLLIVPGLAKSAVVAFVVLFLFSSLWFCFC